MKVEASMVNRLNSALNKSASACSLQSIIRTNVGISVQNNSMDKQLGRPATKHRP